MPRIEAAAAAAAAQAPGTTAPGINKIKIMKWDGIRNGSLGVFFASSSSVSWIKRYM